MASAPTPDPSQQPQGGPPPPPQGGGPPDAGQGQGAPSQAPAPPEMMALARVYQVLQQLAQNPVLSDGAQMAMQGVQKMQSAMVSQPQGAPPSATQNPPM